MSPPAAEVDVLDPESIRDALPPDARAAFLDEYRQATAAARDPARYRELRWLLHTWRLRALARSDPGFERRRAEAADPASDAFVPAAEVLPELETRLKGRG